VTPYLPTPNRLGVPSGKSAERSWKAQSDSRYGLTLALTGVPKTKTDSRKVTYLMAGRNTKSLTTPEICIPPSDFLNIGKSTGFGRSN